CAQQGPVQGPQETSDQLQQPAQDDVHRRGAPDPPGAASLAASGAAPAAASAAAPVTRLSNPGFAGTGGEPVVGAAASGSTGSGISPSSHASKTFRAIGAAALPP